MKSPVLIIISLVFVVSLTFSCKVEKRVHRPGYHVEWYKGKSIQKQAAAKPEEQLNLAKSRELPVKEDMPVSSIPPPPELSANLDEDIEAMGLSGDFKTEVARILENAPITSNQQGCEVIVKTDGTRISAVVREITKTQIKYQRCDYPDGPMIILEASDVDRIIYDNGMEDIISGYSYGNAGASAPQSQSQWQPKRLEVLGLLSFIFAIVGIFFAGIIFGLTALILGFISLTKFTQRPTEFKGKGFAIAGLIIGVVAIIGGILFALAVAAA